MARPPAALAGEVEDERANDASRVLGEILRIPEESIPANLLEEAQAIAVIPNVVKVGFVVGGRRGRGLIAIRGSGRHLVEPELHHPHRRQLRLPGRRAVGTDVILVFRTKRGVDSIVNGKFTLGADASVAAGPVGRSAAGQHRRAAEGGDLQLFARPRPVCRRGARRHPSGRSTTSPTRRSTARATPPGRSSKAAPVSGSDAVVGFRDKLEESTRQAGPGASSGPGADTGNDGPGEVGRANRAAGHPRPAALSCALICEDTDMGLGWKELLIVLVIVLLVFGTKRLKNIGADLGDAVQGFQEGHERRRRVPSPTPARAMPGLPDDSRKD